MTTQVSDADRTSRPITPAQTTVLVTGASGFIGLHCVRALLEAGYVVRGTVRSRARETELRNALAAHVDVGDRLSLVEADLTEDRGWDAAVAGCRFVLHVASPLPRTPPKSEDELIVPAREGTLRVLRAASEADVERVVLTSSVAAVLYGRDRSSVFTESDWSDVTSREIGAYEKSKTLAERAAWEFVESLPEGSQLELAVINPGLVLGPILSEDYGTSGEVIKKLIERDFPACPDFRWATIDVRDVAAAHVAAMVAPNAVGHRHLCADQSSSLRDIALILQRHLGPRGFKIPTGRMPGFIVRIVALFDQTARLGLNDLGKPQSIDNTRLRTVLGIEPRSLEEMTEAMADSMIEYGVVETP